MIFEESHKRERRLLKSVGEKRTKNVFHYAMHNYASSQGEIINNVKLPGGGGERERKDRERETKNKESNLALIIN